MPEENIIEESEKKSIWNVLLTVIIIITAALLALCIYLFMNRSKELDLSNEYTLTGISEQNYTYGNPFAKDLVVSDPSITIEDVMMSSTTEKALLFNIDTKEALFAQAVYDKTFPASITKLMTAILAVKYSNMTDTVIMEESDFDLEEGSQVSGLMPGDAVTMEQLFYSLVVYSANDAANAIARHIDGSVSLFVERMNLEAEKLGMVNTHFDNPHGLHSSTHYTCAYDIYLMMNEAIKYQAIKDAMRLNIYHLIVPRGEYDIMYDLNSTDRYMTGETSLPLGVTILAGKTGTTDEAGSCLTLAVQNKKGVPFITVILNAKDKNVLYEDMTKLLNQIND